MEPTGRIALVTGAAGGLGRAFCRALLAAGAKVIVTDIEEKSGEKFADELKKEFGEGNAIFVKADVTNSASLEEAFKAAKSNFGRLDIVVNNAGVVREDLWSMEIDVNIKGVVNGVLLSLKYMGKPAGCSGGLVVNVSSLAGISLHPVVPIYCATKHAVAALSRCYGSAVHVDNTGVSVVALCPGAADTTILSAIPIYCQHPYLRGPLDEVLNNMHISRPEFIAEGLMKVIREARSGSVWLADDGVIEEFVYPPNM